MSSYMSREMHFFDIFLLHSHRLWEMTKLSQNINMMFCHWFSFSIISEPWWRHEYWVNPATWPWICLSVCGHQRETFFRHSSVPLWWSARGTKIQVDVANVRRKSIKSLSNFFPFFQFVAERPSMNILCCLIGFFPASEGKENMVFSPQTLSIKKNILLWSLTYWWF